MEKEMVIRMARKAGWNSQQVVPKALEYMRLYDVKTSSNGLETISNANFMVICLELAAQFCGEQVNRNVTSRLVSNKQKSYSRDYNTVAKVLGLQKNFQARDICVQLGIPEAAELAEKISKKYMGEVQRTPKFHRLSLTHPMYSVGAVVLACKIKKIRGYKKKLLEMSTLNKETFDKLMKDYASCTNELLEEETKTSKLKDTSDSSKETGIEMPIVEPEEDENPDEIASEDFEDWKKKILGEVNGCAS